MTTTTSSSTNSASLQLDPPSFTIDDGNNDLELFTFRLPVSLPLSALKDVELNLDGSSTVFTVKDKEYRIQMVDTKETEMFRVLIRNDNTNSVKEKEKDGGVDGDNDSSSSSNGSNNSDNEEDDRTKSNGAFKTEGNLRPSMREFSKHFQVLKTVPVLSESQVAPREGPPPADKMRHAYAPVAQRSGLKRRWMPLGVAKANEHGESSVKKRPLLAENVKCDPESPPSKRTKLVEEGSDEGDEDDDSSPEDKKKLSKSERKAKKMEKKAARKARREAKKAKKAAKKAKKSRS